MRPYSDLLVFSHLRWDHVYQRPQHVMTRLAEQGLRVFFIEESVYDKTGVLYWENRTVAPGVTVCRPHSPDTIGAYQDISVLRRLLPELLQAEGIHHYIAWFYTPMAFPLLEGLSPHGVVYDCMDELSAFAKAPRDLIRYEKQLLQVSDAVFTGGRSLHSVKSASHPNAHCFPSSVDAAHFAQAAHAAEPEDQARLPHPRLGYFGVIDERCDLALIDRLAAERPGWQIVMVGPVSKIDRAKLPLRPNLHFTGKRTYQQLPAYLAGWDACLLPFALNDATRFVSPTKTLEYMAAGKPVVSTAIPDVIAEYGEVVYHGEDFIDACERALHSPVPERTRDIIEQTSWDRTARSMLQILDGIRPRTAVPHAQRRVVVAGAGPTGLSAAWHLGEEAVLIEQNDRVGGWCRSIESRGFTFDYAGHIMFSKDEYVHRMYRMLLGDNVHWQDREAWIFSKGVYTRYPFQGALYGLPPEVIKDCVVGAIEARYGSMNGRSPACSSGAVSDCCGDGILESSAPLAAGEAPRNFEEFIYRVWGRGIAKHFAIPYNRKLWAVPLNEMETSWLGGRVPLPDLEEMIDGALRPVPKPMGPNARFGYPLRGGFQALMDGFLPHLSAELRLNTRIVAVSPRRRRVLLATGEQLRYEYLISTMPLPALVRAIGDEAPASVRDAAKRLRHVSVRCVHIGAGREKVTDKHWIYYPEDTVFHRIFVQGNASPYVNPPGGFGFTCEITYSPHKPLPEEGDALALLCIEDCRRVGFLRPDDRIQTVVQCDMPYAYVVYDHARAANIGLIREWMGSQGILLAGRYSEWEYYNSDHAFIAGKKAAESVRRVTVEPEAALAVREADRG